MILELPDAEICTVLVAENDDRVRAAVASVLENDGFATLRAADVPEALAMLSAYRPDFVLLDMNLINGLEIDVRHLTGNDLRLSSVPVIGMGEDKRARVPSGVTALLQKPFDLSEFLRVIGPRLAPVAS